ncbi:MAG: excinuclease ABC subunit UvrB [Armatimonadetes bacterium]|nr:excinuclease ABC subunit UvrB [Armatimonadota bacterium]
MSHTSSFKLQAPFGPAGDQPKAIEQLTDGVQRGLQHQVLLGVTGSGKTFTIANVIAQVNRPTLVIAHNKTLAAQLCSEFREFFPENAVEYFVSFYDYYQPEAYMPHTDTYIEKEATVNEEIDRLRHSATQAVSERRDTIIVASVSCIYGLGSPELYQETTVQLATGLSYKRRELLDKLVSMRFNRNDLNLTRGTFRVRGDVLEVHPADEEVIVRVDFFGEEVDDIALVNPLTGEAISKQGSLTIFPATHYVASEERIERAIQDIEVELSERLAYFQRKGRVLEAQRLEQRTRYDIEMMREVGYCLGIENYSRHLDGRQPGQPPFNLLDYFPKDFLLVIDESHQTIPQLNGMYAGDKSRKDNLVDHGFRLPSAYDNRPLKFPEFQQRVNQVLYTSATPGPYEMELKQRLVEQIARPTGLVDPEVEVRPTKGQIDDLLFEIRDRAEKGQRVLVTTLTKRMAEDLTDYLVEAEIKVHYLHSDIETLERTVILRDLRIGKHDVVVGINLLREGLDLPEVTLVAILDADKEGFLRSEVSLVQTIGRAARNVDGRVIMYADSVTGSMRRAIEETNRRRRVQFEHNLQQGITPISIQKEIREVIESPMVAEERAEYHTHLPGGSSRPGQRGRTTGAIPTEPDDILQLLEEMEREMRVAAKALEFERAAELRDDIKRLRERVEA